jgi:hypothetical protein
MSVKDIYMPQPFERIVSALRCRSHCFTKCNTRRCHWQAVIDFAPRVSDDVKWRLYVEVLRVFKCELVFLQRSLLNYTTTCMFVRYVDQSFTLSVLKCKHRLWVREVMWCS